MIIVTLVYEEFILLLITYLGLLALVNVFIFNITLEHTYKKEATKIRSRIMFTLCALAALIS